MPGIGIRLGIGTLGTGGGVTPSLKERVIALFAGGYGGGLYKVGEPGTLWQDTAGTVPVTGDGQSVARRDDLSGNGNHQVQATSGNRPTYNAGALDLDGTGDALFAAAAYNVAPPWTIITVGSYVSGAGGANSPWSGVYKGSADYARCGLRQNIGWALTITRGGAVGVAAQAANTTAGALAPVTKGAVVGLFAAGVSNIAVYGVASASAANSWTGAESDTGAGPQLSDAGYARTNWGDLIINRILTADEIDLAVSYLMS